MFKKCYFYKEKSNPKEEPTENPEETVFSEVSTISASAPPLTPVVLQAQAVDIPPPMPTTISSITDDCITYCNEHHISNPVEILRHAQNCIVMGKSLNGYTGGPVETINDQSNFILINRQDVLGTALEEISSIEDFQLSLEVSFYGENAQDAGGPRREFFRLCLQEIKQKYFDNGLKEHLSEDYKTVGIVLALSVLQNGNIPSS